MVSGCNSKGEEMAAEEAVASSSRTKAKLFHEYLATGGPRRTALSVPKGQFVFRQGDPADSIFYIEKGRVKISVTSSHGKEAALGFQNRGAFIGEECLAASQSLRSTTAIAVLPCSVLRIDGQEMMQALSADPLLAGIFQSFLLARCVLMQGDLIDHLFNSSEKRLARVLLSLAQLDGEIEATIPYTTQETLAEMIGTTRSRVSFFMNRFRNMGYIQYRGCNVGMTVHHSLFNVLLKD
jgi:CRP-like cAMP-binding protein